MKTNIEELAEDLGGDNPKSYHRRSRLSHVLRTLQDRNENKPFALKDLSSLIKEWELDKELPSVAEQADNLLLWVGKNQLSPDSWAKGSVPAFSARVGTFINPKSPNSGLNWIVRNLVDQGLLTYQDHPIPPQEKLYESGDKPSFHKISLQLTFSGWARYEELTRRSVESRTAFMALEFDDEVFRVVTDCFKPAVAKAGFELRTLRDGQGAGLIDDQLRIALRRAKFVVADLTHANNGAYWEAGFG